MISSQFEFEKATEELEYLRAWLLRLSNDTSTLRSGITESSVRTMMSRISSELEVYLAVKKAEVLADGQIMKNSNIDSAE